MWLRQATVVTGLLGQLWNLKKPTPRRTLGSVERTTGGLPQRISLDEDSLDRWFLLADAALQSVDGRFELLYIQSAAKLNIHVEQHLVGAKLHRQQVTDSVDRRIRFDNLPNSPDSGSI